MKQIHIIHENQTYTLSENVMAMYLNDQISTVYPIEGFGGLFALAITIDRERPIGGRLSVMPDEDVSKTFITTNYENEVNFSYSRLRMKNAPIVDLIGFLNEDLSTKALHAINVFLTENHIIPDVEVLTHLLLSHLACLNETLTLIINTRLPIKFTITLNEEPIDFIKGNRRVMVTFLATINTPEADDVMVGSYSALMVLEPQSCDHVLISSDFDQSVVSAAADNIISAMIDGLSKLKSIAKETDK